MPWSPNGLGAGTGNEVAGGSGGYMSYPQPPTGPNAAFNPPELNGQFGPTNITFNNGIGTYFSIVNPGRNPNS